MAKAAERWAAEPHSRVRRGPAIFMAMTYTILRHADAGAFLARAEAWLLKREAEHNLLLGIARRLRESAAGFERPIFLATVEAGGSAGAGAGAGGGQVVGCAFRTPPYKLGLTRMPAEAVPALVEDVAGVYGSLPAVMGPDAVARAFAERWARMRGVAVRPGLRFRIYELDRVTWPEPRAPGRLRTAAPAEVDRVMAWVRAFADESSIPVHGVRPQTEALIRAGEVFLWEDGEPRCMAAWNGRSPHGVRIGYVYTPPESRGRGYASACVAAASERALAAGYRFCFLYTDLANPTSNSIYQRIGYRPVTDVADWVLGES